MKTLGGRTRLTPRGERAARIAIAIPVGMLLVVLGTTVDEWSPCAGDHVCVVTAP